MVRALIDLLMSTGMSQREIAERFGLSKALVNAWMTGKRPFTFHHLETVVSLTNATLSQLHNRPFASRAKRRAFYRVIRAKAQQVLDVAQEVREETQRTEWEARETIARFKDHAPKLLTLSDADQRTLRVTYASAPLY